MDLLQCSQDCITYQRLDTGEGNRQLFPRLPAAFYCLKMFRYLVFSSDLEPTSGRPIFKDEAIGSHLKSCSKITYSWTFFYLIKRMQLNHIFMYLFMWVWNLWPVLLLIFLFVCVRVYVCVWYVHMCMSEMWCVHTCIPVCVDMCLCV